MKKILCWALLLLALAGGTALAANQTATPKPAGKATATPRPAKKATVTPKPTKKRTATPKATRKRRATATPRPRRTPTPTIRPYVQQESDVFTPSRKTKCSHKNCFWTTYMDITDEKAIWNMLMSPVTVLKGNQKSQVPLRKKPSEKAKVVGEVTCQSQAVHVLSEDQNGWTKIECYSSSFYGSETEQWNQLVEGYVKTELLTTVKPATEMGLVVDKLTQRLYVFMKGKLYTVLRVSTGLPNEKQPYNETRSGEFLFVSRVGTLHDGNMVCELALRFNFGDLIHQVPYSKSGDKISWWLYEDKLGSRASHGCVRVQRKRTPEGVNMQWIVDHYHANTKIVIWEDWKGREKPKVPDDTPVYYNPSYGKTYHKLDHCNNVDARYEPMKKLKFSQLRTKEFSHLTPCVYCNPPEK